ncbi:type VI secretion system-associated protein TagF [Frateuria sp. STR12]|uniref:type VI secretion system-associated protein TagF n=1 Tax=Frateuria hangzhouensis TaxID=2995589 RepID=UPI0022609645|nr:type VI secretion system-associated protein TagF [Frateuria sp. STR12]MCX7514342.1 type VI secretion system-associated protein TagF [Frateuria sp. STR12]
MSGPAGGCGTGNVGFFGKLPGAGDFVQRRLPASFVERWDPHFEQAVHASREALDGDWAQAYRTSPSWRFVLAPQVCGEGAWAGVFGPAEDRVGRSFPMVLAAPLAATQVVPLLRDGAGWFDALARVHTEGQRGAPVDAEGYDALVAALPDPGMLALMPADPSAGLDFSRASHWRLPLPARAIDTVALAALWQRLTGQGGPWCLWWSEGAGRVPPGILATRGLPAPEAYAGFLDAACASAWQTPAGVPFAAGEPSPLVSAPAASPRDAPDDDITVPGSFRHTNEVAAIPPLPVGTPPAELSVQTAPGTAVVRHPACALTLVATDNGAPDPRRRAAAAIASVATELAAADEPAPGTQALRARLIALHPHLRHTGMREDGAVVAARVAGSQAGLLRIGTAGAWHWRGGRLRPLFANAPAQPPLPGGGELDDLLFGGGDASPAPGLGADGAPACEQVTCELRPGDRLALLAGAAHIQLSLATLSQALAATSAADAQARLAQALGPTHSRPWPLAVIEVQP